MTKAKILNRQIVFEGFRRVETISLQIPSLKDQNTLPVPVTREVYFFKSAVFVLPYLPESDQILLNEEFRTGAFMAGEENPWLMECCAGMIDDNEDPTAAAKRELKEETGCDLLDLEFITRYYPTPSSVTEIYHLYCGRIGAARNGVHGLASESEEIRTHLVSADQAIAWLDQGKILNGGAYAALSWFARHKQQLRQKWLGE